MPSKSDLSEWVTQSEAAIRLQTSERTIRRRAANGEIERRERQIRGRSPEAVYNPDDVNRLAAEKPFPFPVRNELQAAVAQHDAPILHPAVGQALVLFQEVMQPVLAQNRDALEKVTTTLELFAQSRIAAAETRPVTLRPWMTIQEASVYSGLGEGLLRRMVKSGELKSRRDRQGVKVRKAELDRDAGALPAAVSAAAPRLAERWTLAGGVNA